MRLNDAFVEVAHKDGYGFYFYKNSTFKGWAVRFERSQYDVEKVYLKDGQIVDDFEEDNDRYRFLRLVFFCLSDSALRLLITKVILHVREIWR